jgi:hypothetical protein
MADLASFIGALFPTLIVSRLLFLTMRSWSDSGYQKIVVCHVGSLIIATLIGGYGMADSGEFAGGQALGTYLVPQLAWFFFDVFRHRRGKDPLPKQDNGSTQ